MSLFPVKGERVDQIGGQVRPTKFAKRNRVLLFTSNFRHSGEGRNPARRKINELRRTGFRPSPERRVFRSALYSLAESGDISGLSNLRHEKGREIVDHALLRATAHRTGNCFRAKVLTLMAVSVSGSKSLALT